MRVWTLALALLTTGCGRGCQRPPPVIADDAAEGDDAVLPSSRPDAPPPRTACRRVGVTPIPTLGQAADAGLQALIIAPGSRGVRTFWSTTGSDSLGHWSYPETTVGRVGAGVGDRSDPVLAVDATGALAAAWVRSGMGVREHVIWTADGDAGRCAAPEGRDEGLSLSLAGLARGWLVAWDEDGPAPAAGSIRVHVATRTPTGLRCGPPRVLSPAAQDAADPTAVALSGGRAAVFWLTARDVDASESNDTATDVWGVAVDAVGAPIGAALRSTRCGWRSAAEARATARGAATAARCGRCAWTSGPRG